MSGPDASERGTSGPDASEPGRAQAPDSAEPAAGRPAGPGDAPLRGVRVLAGDEFSFADAIGGVRGLVESTLPGLVFVVVFVLIHELMPALVASAGVAVVAVVVRLVQRTPITQAFSGVLGVGIGVVWASLTGEAENFYAWGLWVNAAWCVGAAASILAGRPAVGVIVSMLRSEPMTWRTDPDAGHLRRRYTWATWLWAALFGARLAVQVPIYLQGSDAVGWLGTAKLVMGLPLFALGLWITWLLLGSRGARAEHQDLHPTPPR
ncbi:DUF3159 domain-containing protein [Cellulomonas sp. KRMCY2]|uniref:DUF3159 domain-containing protein n=1 Tax=Cellulomonas sp. KRMCY2 TaxID=1304865 RepID=UPI001E605D3D|nr:DUF3159 domain-containing protein [Cellulomonas sp. KRMCY2]